MLRVTSVDEEMFLLVPRIFRVTSFDVKWTDLIGRAGGQGMFFL